MKFSCEKYLLQNAISISSRAVASKSPIPSLEGLLLEAGSKIKVTGYDLKKGIYTSFPADISEPGSIVLGGRLFGEIVRSLPDGIVTINSGERNMTTITCGKAEFSIIGSDSGDYPELPSVDYQHSVSLTQETMKKMINETNFAVSDNESRPVYTGALFEIDNKSLTIVAVDGYRMALRREEIKESDIENTSFIVPGTALSDVEKICSGDEESISITIGSKHISFSIGDTVLVSRRLEGEFLNYAKTIPSEFKVRLGADRLQLQRTVDRVSLIIDDRIKNPLRCTFGLDSVNMTCVTPLGKAEDICPLTGDGEQIEIGFNNRYLLDALKAAPAEKIYICLNNGTSPCIILPEDGSDKFLYMILPVRLKAGD